MNKAIFTLVTATAFFDDVKEWSGPFFDTHQLGVRSNFDVEVNILRNDVTNVKTALGGRKLCGLLHSVVWLFHLNSSHTHTHNHTSVTRRLSTANSKVQ